jgi:hypothetical protein
VVFRGYRHANLGQAANWVRGPPPTGYRPKHVATEISLPRPGKDTMDKLVKRVTVVQGSGQHRTANVVYKSGEEEEDGEENGLERTIRHILKAQVIAAQEAYQRHLDSVAKGGKSWIFDEPSNLMKAQRKAMKEIRKAVPFKIPKIKIEEDEDEDEEEEGD